MGGTRLKGPIVWGIELADVVIYEYGLILGGIKLPERRLSLRNVGLLRV